MDVFDFHGKRFFDLSINDYEMDDYMQGVWLGYYPFNQKHYDQYIENKRMASMSQQEIERLIKGEVEKRERIKTENELNARKRVKQEKEGDYPEEIFDCDDLD